MISPPPPFLPSLAAARLQQEPSGREAGPSHAAHGARATPHGGHDGASGDAHTKTTTGSEGAIASMRMSREKGAEAASRSQDAPLRQEATAPPQESSQGEVGAATGSFDAAAAGSLTGVVLWGSGALLFVLYLAYLATGCLRIGPTDDETKNATAGRPQLTVVRRHRGYGRVQTCGD